MVAEQTTERLPVWRADAEWPDDTEVVKAADYDALKAELADVREVLGQMLNSRNAYQWECERLTEELEASQKVREPAAWMGVLEGDQCLSLRRDFHGLEVEDRVPLYTAPPSAAPGVITMTAVMKAYEYAAQHPERYLCGTSNWCAAMAHSLNKQRSRHP